MQFSPSRHIDLVSGSLSCGVCVSQLMVGGIQPRHGPQVRGSHGPKVRLRTWRAGATETGQGGLGNGEAQVGTHQEDNVGVGLAGFVGDVASQHPHDVVCGRSQSPKRGTDEWGEMAVFDRCNALAVGALFAAFEVVEDGGEILLGVGELVAIEDGDVNEGRAVWIKKAFDLYIGTGVGVDVGGPVLEVVTAL